MKTNLSISNILLKGLKGISIFIVCLLMGTSFIVGIESTIIGYILGAIFILLGTFGFKYIINEEILKTFKYTK